MSISWGQPVRNDRGLIVENCDVKVKHAKKCDRAGIGYNLKNILQTEGGETMPPHPQFGTM